MLESFLKLFKNSLRSIAYAALKGAYAEAQTVVSSSIANDENLTDKMKVAAHQGADIAFEKLAERFQARFD